MWVVGPQTRRFHGNRPKSQPPGETVADCGFRLPKGSREGRRGEAGWLLGSSQRLPGGRGGDLGRPGRRPLGGPEEAAGRPEGKLALPVGALRDLGFSPRGTDCPPTGGLRGGDHASCAKWFETYRKWTFSKGSRPVPLAGVPAHLEHGHRPRRGRFRVILGATLLPDGCPVGVRRQVWTGQGGLKPPCIVTLSMLQPRIVTMRDCTSARSRVSGRVGCGHAARVNLWLWLW